MVATRPGGLELTIRGGANSRVNSTHIFERVGIGHLPEESSLNPMVQGLGSPLVPTVPKGVPGVAIPFAVALQPST